MKKAMKFMLALLIGIVIAFLASHVMSYLNSTDLGLAQNGKYSLLINGGIVLIMATMLVFLECIEGWGDFVPATFLGTVLFFALGLKVPGTSLEEILLKLMIPLALGIAAGYITIVSRAKLDRFLNCSSDK